MRGKTRNQTQNQGSKKRKETRGPNKRIPTTFGSSLPNTAKHKNKQNAVQPNEPIGTKNKTKHNEQTRLVTP